MKKLKLKGEIALNKSKYLKAMFLKRNGFNALASLYPKMDSKLKNEFYYIYIKNLNFKKDLQPFGFKEVYNDWTNTINGYELSDNDFKIFISAKTNKEKISYLETNMTDKNESPLLIETIQIMLEKQILWSEAIEKKN